jgi:hypothetical protein
LDKGRVRGKLVLWEPAPAGFREAPAEEFTMWPATQHLSTQSSDACADADALFVSAMQRSDAPSAGQIRQAITAAIGTFGCVGCAERVAQEFGDHPETAASRMRWARAVTGQAFAHPAAA